MAVQARGEYKAVGAEDKESVAACPMVVELILRFSLWVQIIPEGVFVQKAR